MVVSYSTQNLRRRNRGRNRDSTDVRYAIVKRQFRMVELNYIINVAVDLSDDGASSGRGIVVP